MMKRIVLVFLALIFLSTLVLLFQESTLRYPAALSRKAFDASLGVDRLGKEFIFGKDLDKEIGTVTHKLIEMRLQEWNDKAKNRIPFSIHQIWMGEGEMPDDFARGAQSIKLFHKDIPYTLWTEKEYEPFLSNMFSENTWRSLPKDLLRSIVTASILIKEGGVVIAPETECVQSITPLLSLADCIVGFAPPSPKSHFKRHLLLSPGVIAAAPAHPLIEVWLKEMLLRSASREDIMKSKKFYEWVVLDSFTTVFASEALKCGKPLLVGPTYFCPISSSHIDEFQAGIDGSIHRSTFKKVLQFLHIVSAEPYSDVTHDTIILNLKNPVETKKEGC